MSITFGIETGKGCVKVLKGMIGETSQLTAVMNGSDSL